MLAHVSTSRRNKITSTKYWLKASKLEYTVPMTTDDIYVPVIIGAVVALPALWQWWRVRGWRSWPYVNGVIQTAEVREESSRAGSYFIVDLGYSYEVDGEYYSGHLERTESEPYVYARAMKDAQVVVHYRPNKPELSKVKLP